MKEEGGWVCRGWHTQNWDKNHLSRKWWLSERPVL